jgi:hypothetical protein
MPHAMALHLKGSEPEPVEVVGCTLAPRATASVADSASHAADALAHLHRMPVEVGRVPGRAEIRRPGRRCRSRTPRRVLRMPQFKDGNCDFHGSVPYPQLSEFQTAAVPGTHLMWGAGGEAPRAGEDVPRRLRRTVLNRLRERSTTRAQGSARVVVITPNTRRGHRRSSSCDGTAEERREPRCSARVTLPARCNTLAAPAARSMAPDRCGPGRRGRRVRPAVRTRRG